MAPLQIRQVQSTASGRGEGQSPTLADPTKGVGGFGCYGFVRAEEGAELFRLHFDYVADPPATGCLAPEWQDVFIGAQGGAPEETIKACFGRMRSWVILAPASMAAEFPSWEIAQDIIGQRI